MRTSTSLLVIAIAVSGCCRMPGSSNTNDDGKATPTSTTKPAATATDHSPPPTFSEWGSAIHVNAQGEPDGCELRHVREWFQLYCRHCEHDKKGGGVICSERTTWEKGTITRGAAHGEVFFYEKANPADHSAVSSVVFPLRQGGELEIRLPGKGGPDAVLEATWPHGASAGTVHFR